VTVASAHYITSHALYVNSTYQSSTTYTPVTHPAETAHQPNGNLAYGMVSGNVPGRQPFPHFCDGALDEAACMVDNHLYLSDAL
jgi:hypothetical protein